MMVNKELVFPGPCRGYRSGNTFVPINFVTKVKVRKRLTIHVIRILQRWQIYHNIAPLLKGRLAVKSAVNNPKGV